MDLSIIVIIIIIIIISYSSSIRDNDTLWAAVLLACDWVVLSSGWIQGCGYRVVPVLDI
jgi:hypothetical protein